jgi:iron complex outermembrane receptor protein
MRVRSRSTLNRVSSLTLAVATIIAQAAASAAGPGPRAVGENVGPHDVRLVQATTAFDLPAQPLAQSLRAVGSVTNTNILFDPPLVKNFRAPELKAEVTTDEALLRLLSGTGIKHEFMNESTVVVGADDGKLTRLAQSEAAPNPGADPAEAPHGGDGDRLGEIVVTAQKRLQFLKDVPISMTAYNSATLEKLRVGRLQDIVTITPGVDYDEVGPFYSNVHIRGINTAVGGVYQTVAITLDDATLITTFNGFVMGSRLFDVERIEVLRGPQGTLTGSSSTSGTINIITKKPDLDAFGGDVTVDFGRFDTQLVRGSVNLPLSDKAAVRAVGFTESSRGAIRNTSFAGGTSSYDNYGARVALRLAPTENLLIDAALNYERQRDGLLNTITNFVPGYDDPENADALWAQTISHNFNFLDAAGGSLNNSPFITRNRNGLDGALVRKDAPEYANQTISSATLNAGYDLGNHKLAFLYSHLDYLADDSRDGDLSEWAIWLWKAELNPVSDYGELRMTSNYDGPFNWVAGASYMKERRVERGSYTGGDDYGFMFGEPGAAAPVPGGAYDPESWFAVLEGLESQALFANAFWDISDRIHLSAGARATFSKSFTAYGGEGGADRDFVPDFSNKTIGDTTEINPRVAVNFDLSDDVTTYIQYATGFRPGYGNTDYERALAVGLSIPEVADGEKLKNYEVGLKGSFFDRRLDLSLAAYYMDYSGMQITLETDEVVIDGVVQRLEYDSNAASSSAKGFELEGRAYLTDNLVLSGGVSYVDGTIDEIEEDGVLYRDVRFPKIRPWTGTAALQYTRDIGNDMEAVVRVDYNYHDKTEGFPWWGEGPAGVMPAHHLFDLSFGVEKDDWSAQGYFENVTNEPYWLSTDMYWSPYGVNVVVVPRMFGIRLTKRFGQ